MNMNKNEAQQELSTLKIREKKLLDIINKPEDKEKIISVDQSCKYLGLVREDEIPFKEPKNADQINTNSYVLLKIVIRAVNKIANNGIEWIPASGEKRWYQYWDITGVGFVFYNSHYDRAAATVGSRLTFKMQNDMLYVSKIDEFIELYKKLIKE